MDDLYEYPAGTTGRKTYVSVRGHSRSIPKFKTYRGVGGLNYVLPEYGGNWDGLGNQAPFFMPDKAEYHSPLDKTVVAGRFAHREHMKRHGVLEAGDYKIGEMSHVERAPMPSVRESFNRAMAEYT